MTVLKDSFRRIGQKLNNVVSSVKGIRTRGNGKQNKPTQRDHRYYT